MAADFNYLQMNLLDINSRLEEMQKFYIDHDYSSVRDSNQDRAELATIGPDLQELKSSSLCDNATVKKCDEIYQKLQKILNADKSFSPETQERKVEHVNKDGESSLIMSGISAFGRTTWGVVSFIGREAWNSVVEQDDNSEPERDDTAPDSPPPTDSVAADTRSEISSERLINEEVSLPKSEVTNLVIVKDEKPVMDERPVIDEKPESVVSCDANLFAAASTALPSQSPATASNTASDPIRSKVIFSSPDMIKKNVPDELFAVISAFALWQFLTDQPIDLNLLNQWGEKYYKDWLNELTSRPNTSRMKEEFYLLDVHFRLNDVLFYLNEIHFKERLRISPNGIFSSDEGVQLVSGKEQKQFSEMGEWLRQLSNEREGKKIGALLLIRGGEPFALSVQSLSDNNVKIECVGREVYGQIAKRTFNSIDQFASFFGERFKYQTENDLGEMGRSMVKISMDAILRGMNRVKCFPVDLIQS